ncbi:MAG TPA: RsmE family RNA methyltransferase [Ignavibacteria bacterium]|nr:RsmE family RNA methyltransferase [Ignavibacteria bacterium]
MEYYYTPKHYISSATLTIVDDEAKHLGRVLRKQQGEEIFVTDGEGSVYRCKINNLAKELIDCSIIEKISSLNEPKIKINLYQSLIKNPDRFEFAIEKAVELGINTIHPVITEHVINKTTNKHERWQSIALAAMKQSQRCVLPRVNGPVSFAEAVSGAISEIKLIADEKENDSRISLADIKDTFSSIDILIGPEGGFTSLETELAVTHGFKILSLGARKFRSETASIYTISKLL